MLRVIKNRKSKYVSIGHSCKPELWDIKTSRPKKSHPNKTRLDIYISAKITEVEKMLLDLENMEEEFAIETLTTQIKSKASNINVYDFIDKIVKEETQANKIGTAGVYAQTKSMLRNFHGNDSLRFTDITVSFLKKYESFFRKKGTKEISISFYMRTLRAVMNRAIAEKYCNKNIYPFKDYSIANLNTKTVKRAISKDAILRIMKLDYKEGSRLFHSKNIFLFSYFAQGMNFIDIAKLKWSDINKGRLTYTRAKTNKIYDVGLIPPALEILEHYKKLIYTVDGDYVFPILSGFHDTEARIKNRVHKIIGQTDKDLKIIAKDVFQNW
jgi:hypothetical protein